MQWSVIVRMDSTNNWYRGPRRFPTEADAKEWGEQFYQSHPSVKEYRVEPAPAEEEPQMTRDRQ